MRVDWDEHRLLAESGDGKDFRIDTGQSIKDQLSRMYQLLVKHTEDLRHAYSVTEIEVFYGLIREITLDEKKFKEALQFLDLIIVDKMPEWADKLPPDIEMRYVSKNLRELGINIEHNKPKSA